MAIVLGIRSAVTESQTHFEPRRNFSFERRLMTDGRITAGQEEDQEQDVNAAEEPATDIQSAQSVKELY